MTARFLAFIRFLKRALSFAAVLLLLLVLGASLGAYLTLTGKSLPTLRFVTAKAGQLFTGQRTERLVVDVHVSPENGRLTGTATLTVRSLQPARRRFYFLLNAALRLRQVRVDRGSDAAQPVSAYQLWLLTVVDLTTPVEKDETVDLTFDYDGQPATAGFSVGASVMTAQQVLLPVDSFWYPSDVQSFFVADVTLALPNTLTVVHNGPDSPRAQRGTDQVIHWTSERPVAGMSLVAGPYELTAADIDGTTYRLYLTRDVQLDAKRILKQMADANRLFTTHFGASGFQHVTAFVSRNLRRAFNDGSGLLGLSIRHFRAGDYGYGILAHEIAHDWWGGTVSEKWLAPGSGGEWIVEGFAELASLVAAEARYGPDALTHRLTGEFFDPMRQTAIADMSVLDNAFAESTARDTIYRKGAYVAMMLRRTLGDEVYFHALREFIERFRYQHATDRDLQQVMQDVSQQNLDRFFADWVRSNHLADLSLDASQTDLTVGNLGNATSVGDLELWTVKKDGGPPLRTTVHVGDRVPLPADGDAIMLDPLLTWADVQRENNRYPRRNDPVYVAAAPPGDLAVTSGAAFPWVRATISSWRDGKTQHTWDFTRGVTDPPMWAPDGARLIAAYSENDSLLQAVVTLAADGPQRTVGYANTPMPGSGGVIYAARQDCILRLGTDGSESTVVRRHGEVLESPLPSPDGSQLAFSATHDNHLDLRVSHIDGHDDRLVLAWDRDRMVYRWALDGAHLYAIVGGNADWQIWEIPIVGGGVRVLAQDAAAIGDLAVSPDGKQLAFTAAPALDYPANRRQLYVMNLADRAVHPIDVPDFDLGQLAWLGDDALAVVATAVPSDLPWTPLARRTLKRVRPSDSTVQDM